MVRALADEPRGRALLLDQRLQVLTGTRPVEQRHLLLEPPLQDQQRGGRDSRGLGHRALVCRGHGCAQNQLPDHGVERVLDVHEDGREGQHVSRRRRLQHPGNDGRA
eukprot:6373219-Pyramimonas_sp.AAC.1